MNAPEAIPAAALLPLDSIYQSPTNPRKHFDAAKLSELAISIKEHGVLQPILVRAWQVGMANPTQRPMVEMMSTYEIVCGERRWRASQIAGSTTILAIVRELTDKQVLELQVVENLQREDVHPLEEAEGYERLMKYHDYTADSLGDKIGKSRAYIYARIKLLALVPPARDLFFEGKLTASTALLIARIPGATLQIKAAGEITKPTYTGDPMSYRAAADFLQRTYTLDLDDATWKMDDATLVKKAGSCDACPHRSGNDLILFAEIEDPNVCTNPPCFADKRETNFLRLKEIAQKSGREIVSGKEAEEALFSGRYSLEKFNLANLDDTCRDDPDQRSYRDILGKQAPAVTYVEDKRHGMLVEAVDTKLLAIALKKAGIKPPAGKTGKTDRADNDYQREREESEAKTKAENLWRGDLFQAVRVKISERFAATKLRADDLAPLAVALYLKERESGNATDLMTLWGFEAPEEDDFDTNTDLFVDTLKHRIASELWLFINDLSLIDDATTTWYDVKENRQPELLLAAAKRFDIDAQALRAPPPEPAKVQSKTAKSKAAKPASTPSDAAHAGEISATAAPADSAKPVLKADAKKTKAKANPAPSSTANEAAAPPKSTPMPAWPFPTGASAK
jgi:ParB/RepB/Spo0J family partition protein